MTSHATLLRDAKRRPLAAPGAGQRVDLGRADLERMLPHREPMLLVDRIVAVDLDGESLWAERRVDAADPVLRGHFPDQPVYPGALLVEAMGQAALCLHHLLEHGRASVLPADRPRPVRLLRVHEAMFLRECLPGDRLDVVCRRVASDALCMTCAAQVLRDGAVAALALLDVYLPEDG